jgi:hypothetical protein
MNAIKEVMVENQAKSVELLTIPWSKISREKFKEVRTSRQCRKHWGRLQKQMTKELTIQN